MIDRLDPLGNFLLDDKVENCVITGGQRCSLIYFWEDGHPTKEREKTCFFFFWEARVFPRRSDK